MESKAIEVVCDNCGEKVIIFPPKRSEWCSGCKKDLFPCQYCEARGSSEIRGIDLRKKPSPCSKCAEIVKVII
jgi:hypothetical protein